MKKIVVLTGAGISAESGLKTFRDSNGLWENHKIEDVATPQAWKDNPEIVLYDEPTAGLDPISSTVIENLVRDLQNDSEGCGSYVMVSHQDSTIRRTADRVIFLYGGKIQWEGKVNEIDSTNNPIVRQFFNASVKGPIRVTD